MVSHLFFYQLGLIALVWLCVPAPWGMAQRPCYRSPDATGAPTSTAKAHA
jgi:hypothetical protein